MKEFKGNAFLEFVRRYRHDPRLFAREVLGIELDEWQAEMAEAIDRGERRLSIRSGHGVGKSTGVSVVAIWFVLTRFPVKVVVTAPTSAQLYDALFAEMKALIGKAPKAVQDLFNIKAERIELNAAPESAFITARTSRAEQPEALQGIHSENVLLIADEASGVPEAVFEAAAGSMSGENAATILLGNPTRSSGFFYDTHTRLKDNWWTRQVSCVEVSKRNPSRVSPEYVKEMAERYGENSNAFRVRVLGEFPLADDDTVIPIHLIDAAMTRDIVDDTSAPMIWGLDVARFGSDKSALAKRRGNVVAPIQTWAGLDTMQLVGMVVSEYWSTPLKDRPLEILVDVIGIGSGVCDRLRELDLPARGINVAEAPAMKGNYANLRAELWFATKAWLEQRGSRLPKDENLLAEMAAPKYGFTTNGKLKIESKEDMRKRGVASPDRADAVVLTMAADAATAIYGTAAGGGWSKPILRNLGGIA